MEHIDASIKHLKEAIEQAKMGHADVASKHIDAALNEMHAYSAMAGLAETKFEFKYCVG